MGRNYPGNLYSYHSSNYNAMRTELHNEFERSKNNQNSTQKTEQTTTSSVDSTKININPKNY